MNLSENSSCLGEHGAATERTLESLCIAILEIDEIRSYRAWYLEAVFVHDER